MVNFEEELLVTNSPIRSPFKFTPSASVESALNDLPSEGEKGKMEDQHATRPTTPLQSPDPVENLGWHTVSPKSSTLRFYD
jgi:hypothetical protein